MDKYISLFRHDIVWDLFAKIFVCQTRSWLDANLISVVTSLVSFKHPYTTTKCKSLPKNQGMTASMQNKALIQVGLKSQFKQEEKT